MPLLKNPYAKDQAHVFTPVYIPGESYSFCINGVFFTDPGLGHLELQIRDAAGHVVAANFAELFFINPFNVLTPIFIIWCVFPFPYIPSGYYNFVVWHNQENRVALKSNPILVENDVTDTTMLLEYWDDEPRYGVPFDTINILQGSWFHCRVRLPLAQIDLQFDSDKTTYRNVSDRSLRTLKSYRDRRLKIEARMMDDDSVEALSAALEHKYVLIDGLTIETKTAVTTTPNTLTLLNKSNFEAYANNPETQHGFFAGYGGLVFLTGNAQYHPNFLIHT